jgi:hypothetical protein
MPSEWIERRYQRYQERIAKEVLEASYKQNALTSFPSIFDQTQRQVASDVEEYNTRFEQDAVCPAVFTPVGSGFRIEVNGSSVRIRTTVGSTVIQLQYTGIGRNEDRLELVPDNQGHLFFKPTPRDGIPDLLTVEQASEYILDPVLCR